MVFHIEIEDISHHRLDLLYTGVTKFENTFAIGTNEMIVLLVRIGLLKLRQVFAELMFGDQVTGKQMLNGIVDGSPRNAVLLILHVDIQRLHIKVIVDGIDLFQNGEPFWCLALTLFFEKSRKYLTYLFLGAFHEANREFTDLNRSSLH